MASCRNGNVRSNRLVLQSYREGGGEGIKTRTTFYYSLTEGINSATVHLRVSDLVCCPDEAEFYKYGRDG